MASKKGSYRLRALRHRTEFLLARAMVVALHVLPERFSMRLGELLGRVLYWILRGRRRVGRDNLRAAFPERSEAERRRILVDSFENLGRFAVEVGLLFTLDDDEIRSRVRYRSDDGELMHHYKKALARGKGVLLVTGHIGNWELMALAHSLHGYRMHVVARTVDNPWLARRVHELRCRGGNRVTYRRSGLKALRNLVKELHGGRVVGSVVDQYASRSQAVLVPFFGRLASSHRGPAQIALKTGAAVVPAFIRRDEGRPGHFWIYDRPEVRFERSGDEKEDIGRLTAAIQKAVEDEIRSRPGDWMWIHARWKRSPSPTLEPQDSRQLSAPSALSDG